MLVVAGWWGCRGDGDIGNVVLGNAPSQVWLLFSCWWFGGGDDAVVVGVCCWWWWWLQRRGDGDNDGVVFLDLLVAVVFVGDVGGGFCGWSDFCWIWQC